MDLTDTADARLAAPLVSRSVAGRLQRTLRANAIFSAATGAIGVVAAGPMADVLGLDQGWLVRLLGAGLLGFAAITIAASRGKGDALRRNALLISLADLAWVAGTIVVIGAGWLSSSGAVLMAALGAIVLALAVTQLRERRRMIADSA